MTIALPCIQEFNLIAYITYLYNKYNYKTPVTYNIINSCNNTVKAFYFVGQNFGRLKATDIFVGTWLCGLPYPRNTRKKPKNLRFLTNAKLRPNIKTESFAKLRISDCLTSHQKILIHRNGSRFSQPNFIRRLSWHQTCHLRDYIHKDAMGAGSFKGLF